MSTDELFYNSDIPHSDLAIHITHSCVNRIGLVGISGAPALTYRVSDSSGQEVVYMSDLGTRSLLVINNGSSFDENESRAIAFIKTAHTAMLSLGYTNISTDQGDVVDFEVFGIDAVSIAHAIAESNNLSGG